MCAPGYSVFAVRPVDPSNPENMLPETEADLLAETLEVNDFEGQRPAAQISTARTHSGSAVESDAVGGSSAKSPPPTGLEGEDLQLQRALQASLAAGYSGELGALYDEPSLSTHRSGSTFQGSSSGPSSRRGAGLGYGGDGPRSGSSSRRATAPVTRDASDPPTPSFEADESDPIAASAARAKLRLEQMQREQAAAMQAMGNYGFGAGMADAVEQDPEATRRRRDAQERVRRAREEVRIARRLSLRDALITL